MEERKLCFRNEKKNNPRVVLLINWQSNVLNLLFGTSTPQFSQFSFPPPTLSSNSSSYPSKCEFLFLQPNRDPISNASFTASFATFTNLKLKEYVSFLTIYSSNYEITSCSSLPLIECVINLKGRQITITTWSHKIVMK